MVLQHFLTDSTTSDLAEEETEKEIFIQEKKKEKKVLKVRKCGRKTQKIIYHDFSDLLPLFQGFFCARESTMRECVHFVAKRETE